MDTMFYDFLDGPFACWTELGTSAAHSIKQQAWAKHQALSVDGAAGESSRRAASLCSITPELR